MAADTITGALLPWYCSYRFTVFADVCLCFPPSTSQLWLQVVKIKVQAHKSHRRVFFKYYFENLALTESSSHTHTHTHNKGAPLSESIRWSWTMTRALSLCVCVLQKLPRRAACCLETPLNKVRGSRQRGRWTAQPSAVLN